MSNYQRQSETLSSGLELSMVPVAIAFCDEQPVDIPMFDDVVAAGCKFWELASTRTFATRAQHHRLCAIGIHTHNLAGAPESQATELGAALQAMIGLDYVRPDEVAAIPVNKHSSRYVVYGPLHSFPMTAQVIVLFADARQGLVLSEAIARVDEAIPLAMGRPACAIVPHVMNNGVAALSLGCCGARAYLDVMTDTLSLWALPGKKLARYSEQVDTLSAANRVLGGFHQQRNKDVMAGEEPTVALSLQRM